jgi:DNA-binding NtrC family response regulator
VYRWPGNVREVKNVVERAFILRDESIDDGALGLPAQPESSAPDTEDGAWLRVRIGRSIADVERQLILATLEAHEGDKAAAARVLGISVKTLYNRLNVYKGG